ncbi:bifunctional diguanylate cyclase/phosphodiesterase [Paraburkholderia nemoris]|nr:MULTISPECIES: bifunctional diguanylate cyclase/phosphodiesterase [Paraburkholderia]KPD14662.1 diguanylate phosphodiesterase [Burkholderia sp. ST111]MBK5149007.1 bifunctional diguanylate cyclase/phosphodiesterase [Burkholderia sp. R-69608]MBK3739856.1 bifunctional diguanylate cyclase/phosphodiesterase [Paraburkholderia aspalathi]MBK3784735.1 bifunctional diguanylate cyclase/phosphodiesterase [Paraburkholderia aspalathi]MBK3809920.1 bifunctional diguanylate cyclase/phosphodiesterase [Paraburk
MLSTSTKQLSDSGLRDRFHRRSLEHQRPLSTVTMAFTVVAFLCLVGARNMVNGPATPLAYRLTCALVLALLVMAIPRAGSTWTFGAIGVAYSLVLVVGLALNVSGVEQPLLWILPAMVVIPICAAPLWLTPLHFFVGSALFYGAAFALLFGGPRPHDVDIVVWMWILAIGVPTSVVFHFGFYRFRRNHFLLESQLAQLAATDPLTGLQNRRAFVKQAERRLETMTPEARVSAIFLDIDSFKSLNDRFGHAVGDHALYEVAQVLMEETSADDSVSRIGGEEFAVLLRDGLTGALALAERLRAAIAAIERPDGHLTASFGVAEHRSGENIMVLLDRADEALLRAKHSGRNRVCAERALPIEPLHMLAGDGFAESGALLPRHRWDEYSLTSHFQPLYSLSHQKQVGFEALLRGEQDDGTLVPPVVLFAPKPSSDEGALDRASHAVHLANARKSLPGDAWLFLNILPATFIAEGYADQLAMIVRAVGLEPERVILEILESHGGSVDDMSRAAALYREHGFLIAVDDFGAGQSNLDRLLRIRPDLVKLDGELIRATGHGTEQPILPKLVSLLHLAGMLVVVEGVETTEELILAVESNVDFAQGFLLGRPAAEIVPPDSVHRRIDDAFDVIAQGRAHQYALFESEVEPYRGALRRAADALIAGVSVGEAFAFLATFERCISCFVLDDSGRQVGVEVRGPAWSGDGASLQPVANPQDARWDHRPYFRNAVLLPGVAVASNPYLSLASGRPCVAVTLAVQFSAERSVIGVELDWSVVGLPWPAGE